MIEKRLMQLMIFGYVATLIYCAVTFLATESFALMQPALYFWAAWFGFFGLKLIAFRQGWVPARRSGPIVVQGKVAVFIGTLYFMFAVGLGALGYYLPTIMTV